MHAIWILTACVLTFASASLTPLRASDATASTPELDKLFVELKSASDEPEAKRIAQEIWSHWLRHPNSAVQHHMNLAQIARRAKQLEKALTELNKVVELAPKYAEGWNQRATILFMLGRHQESVADIQQVLRFEPRHFGALAGLGLIHMRAENWKSAKASFERALELHPFLGERGFIPVLNKKIKGRSL